MFAFFVWFFVFLSWMTRRGGVMISPTNHDGLQTLISFGKSGYVASQVFSTDSSKICALFNWVWHSNDDELFQSLLCRDLYGNVDTFFQPCLRILSLPLPCVPPQSSPPLFSALFVFLTPHWPPLFLPPSLSLPQRRCVCALWCGDCCPRVTNQNYIYVRLMRATNDCETLFLMGILSHRSF